MKHTLPPLIALLLAPLAALHADDTPDIGSRRELFVDRFIVGELKNTVLKLHEPQFAAPVSPPRPHGHYATMLRAEDKFQFYYVSGRSKPASKERNKTSHPGQLKPVMV